MVHDPRKPGNRDWTAFALAALVAAGSRYEWLRMLGALMTGASGLLLAAMWFMQGEGE